MILYADQHLDDADRTRAITLPLWPDAAGANGIDPIGGTGAGGTSSHVTPTHPLLSRQGGAEASESKNKIRKCNNFLS